MRPIGKWITFVVFLVMSWSGRINQAAEPPAWTWQHDELKHRIALCGEKTIWEFHYANDLPKTFFHPVALTDGTVLTWNSPPDHPWHHALWFSWKFINGVNYWEPDGNTGKPSGLTQWNNVKFRTHKSGKAQIEMHLDYRHPQDTIVMTEERSIAISAPDESGRYHFDWTGEFTAVAEQVTLDRTPLPDEPGGQPYGGYAGLSVRFAKELGERQAVSNEGPIEFNPESRYRGKACAVDYNGKIGGQDVGIAICDHPDNQNHPSPWYVIRTQAMSYYSPAVICYAPYSFKAGERLTLKYRVIIHPNRFTADQLTKEYEQFVRDSKGEP